MSQKTSTKNQRRRASNQEPRTKNQKYIRTTIWFLSSWLLVSWLLVLDVCFARQSDKRPDVNWYVYTDTLQMGISKLAMISPDEGWIGGSISEGKTSKNLLYHYKNGQWTLHSKFPVETQRAHVLDAVSPKHLWVCSFIATDEETYEGLRINHYDGETWTYEIVSPGIWPQTMDMISKDEGWIGGNHGLLLHYKHGVWEKTSINVPEEKRQHWNILDLKMINAEEGWAVGERGLVVHYENGRWDVIAVPEKLKTLSLKALDFTDDGTLWVVGKRGLIARFEGNRWDILDSPVTEDLLGIDMLSPTDGWVVGRNGTILRYKGAPWERVFSPTQNSLVDIKMTSPAQGWAVGNRIILKSTQAQSHLFKKVSLQKNRLMIQQPVSLIAAVDIDNDEDNDFLFFSSNTIRLYKNGDKGLFFDDTDHSGLGIISGMISEMITNNYSLGDIDNDDDLDLYLVVGKRTFNRLFLNHSGQFVDKTEETGVERGGGENNTAYFIDIDTDGDLDLYVSRQYGSANIFAGNYLYLNDGFGGFTLTDSTTGMKGSEVLVLWGDLDSDMDLDAVLPSEKTQLVLYLNDGKGHLLDATEESGLDILKGDIWQGHLFDTDLDGDLDILVLGERLHLFFNDGNAHFTPAEALFSEVRNNTNRSSMMSNTGDINHDSYLDFFVQPTADGIDKVMFFLHREDGTYEDIAPHIGLDKLSSGNVVFSDLDSDGDLDLYLPGRGIRHNVHLENQQNDNNYLKIRPHGILSNRKAVGAKILIYESGHLGDNAFLRGHQQVGVGGNPRAIQNLSEIHFGLSSEKKYDIQTIFPYGKNGNTVVERSVSTGQTLHIYEYPFGVRHAILFYLAGVRAVHFADIGKEIPLLFLVIFVLFIVCFKVCALIGAEQFMKRWDVLVLITLAYLISAGSFVEHESQLFRFIPISGFFVIVTSGLIADRSLTLWKDSHHLGHYRLHNKLGEGGMGIVYRARDIVTKQSVALKVLHPKMTEGEKNKTRFLREAKLMSELKHPNIVQIYATGEADGKGYISMEILEGMTFSQCIKQSGTLHPKTLIEIILSVCDALAYIHEKGIIHRDVKSENIFIVQPPQRTTSRITQSWHSVSRRSESAMHFEGEWHLSSDKQVKLMDFGLARSSEMKTITQVGGIVGTLAYMPPEQVQGKRVTEQSDVYSLGVVMYEALTGRLPFQQENENALLQLAVNRTPPSIREFNPGIPPELDEIVMKMLRHKSSERYASVKKVKDVLENIEIDEYVEELLENPPVYHLEETPVTLSQKSIACLSKGNIDDALRFSKQAVENLEKNYSSAANSRQVYFNHYSVLKHAGRDNEAEGYIQKAYDSVVQVNISDTEEFHHSFMETDEVDKDIILAHKTQQWMKDYREVQLLMKQGKNIDAHLILMQCIHSIKEILTLLDSSKRESYIKNYKVNDVIALMNKLNK